MKYEISLDDENYVTSCCHTGTDRDIYEFDAERHEFNAFHLVGNEVILDEEREARIIAEKEAAEKERAKIPTWQENIEAQVVYTAMMTDTLLEE